MTGEGVPVAQGILPTPAPLGITRGGSTYYTAIAAVSPTSLETPGLSACAATLCLTGHWAFSVACVLSVACGP
eukprot:6822119-Prymnesium_polylepis.2